MNDPVPVLMVHNRYRQRGGEDIAFENDIDLLREHGHPVTVYEQSNDRIHGMNRWHLAARTIWSLESSRDVAALIRRCRPGVVHLHNTFPLISPSVNYAAARHGVPVVQQLHNYRFLCPNALFLRNNELCEECLAGSWLLPSIRHGCYRGSRPATAAVATMLMWHRLMRSWKRKTTLLMAPSEFTWRKFIEAGFAKERLVVRPNYLITDPGIGTGVRDGVLFVGMLQPWKGIDVLLEAWRQCPPSESLRIVGGGIGADALRESVADMPRTAILGTLDAAAVYAQMHKARFLVFPSLGYETFGRTIVEAFACGTPVIASRRGAAADIVRDGETGFLFQPGDPASLAEKIRWALAHPADMQRMGLAARREFETRYTASAAYSRLMRIYDDAIDQYAGGNASALSFSSH